MSRDTSGTFSIESLISWLKTMPADDVYSYSDIYNCLMAQYFRAKGFRAVSCGSDNFTHTTGWWIFSTRKRERIPRELNSIAIGGTYTFGAALKRACRFTREEGWT